MKRLSRPALACAIACLMPLSTPALADGISDDEPENSKQNRPVAVFAEVTLLSDYRFRGLSYSAGDPVAQGTVTLLHESGFYGGLFASSLSDDPFYGDVEIDIFAGWTGEIAPRLTADATVLYYYYPDAVQVPGASSDSFETAFQLSAQLGVLQPKIGIWYSWKQAALGNQDNFYLFADLTAPIPQTPLSATVHIGHTDGAHSQAADNKTFDWSAGLELDAGHGIALGIDYIGMSGPRIRDFTDDTVMLRASIHF